MPLLLLAARRRPGVTRTRVLEAVRARPGLSVKRLSEHLGLAWHAVEHHLRRLQAEGRASLVRERRRLGAYPAGLGERERKWLRHLSEPRSRTLMAALRRAPAGPAQLGRQADLSAKVARRALQALARDGLVERGQGPRPRYRLADAPPAIEGWDAGLPGVGGPAAEASGPAASPEGASAGGSSPQTTTS
jgi:DNA-binding MarR family transcriptional regulator